MWLGGILVALSSYLLVANARSFWPFPRNSVGLGALPSWLPHHSTVVGRVVTANVTHHWIAIEGDSVRVDLAAGELVALVVGPQVPEQGGFPIPRQIECTFDLSLSNASRTITVRAAQLTVLDELGHLHHPQMLVNDRPARRVTLSPGMHQTVILRSVLPPGAGDVRWTPLGHTPIVAWDFDVEID